MPYIVYPGSSAKVKEIAYADENTPIIVKNQYGEGAIILILIPHNVGLDERVHPCIPYLMNLLTKNILPFEFYTNGKKLMVRLCIRLIKRKMDGL